jgi:8-oxo-dGTP diphosphatase
MSIEVTPDGRVVDFNAQDKPKRLEYVNGFMFNESTRSVLFIQKNRPDFQKGKWNGIGGKVEPGEQPIDAMVREFREETGVQSAPEDWTSCIHLEQPAYRVHFYRCFVDSFPAYRTVTDEVVRVWTIDDVYGAGNWGAIDTLPNMKWILPMLANRQIAWPVTIHLQLGTT